MNKEKADDDAPAKTSPASEKAEKDEKTEKAEKADREEKGDRRITYNGERDSVLCAGIEWMKGKSQIVDDETADTVLTNPSFTEGGSNPNYPPAKASKGAK